ncbi:MAG TPA: helix-turn-helix domain-containing protein [Candidatus Limnocylindria bacterium]|nr:helix-turn-helix domain-containing protein [Candidatus Limnocylindria bacterium]
MTGLRDRKKIRQREALVDAAIRLFEKRGIDATSIDDIAEAVDVSRATVFNYFAYKEAILVEIGARLVADIATQAQARQRRPRSARQTLYDLADALAVVAERHPGVVPYIAREMTHPDPTRRRYAAERMQYPMLYQAILDALETDGLLRGPAKKSSYARQLVDLATGALVRAGHDFPISGLRAELRANVDLFFDGGVTTPAS